MIKLTVDSKKNCLQLPGNTWTSLKKVSQKCKLKKGTYVVRIKKGNFSFWASGKKVEPFVMIMIHGGLFKNLATDVETSATMETLNGYNDTITLEVKRATTFYAFFLDSHKGDNRGKIELSILNA